MSNVDMWESTAFPEGPPHLIDRLDAAIDEAERVLRSFAGLPCEEETLARLVPRRLSHALDEALVDLIAVASEARAALEEYR